MSLTGKDRRYLRGLGHHLDPVVHVGGSGMTDGLVSAVDKALLDHELVKIRVGQNAPDDRRMVSSELARRTESHEVQVLGRTILLYRPHPETPRIRLGVRPFGLLRSVLFAPDLRARSFRPRDVQKGKTRVRLP